MTEGLISTPDAAKRLGVSARTLQRYVKRGLLTPSVILANGEYRWDYEQLREQMRDLRRRDG